MLHAPLPSFSKVLLPCTNSPVSRISRLRSEQPECHTPVGRDLGRQHAQSGLLGGCNRRMDSEDQAEHQVYWPQRHRDTEGIDSTGWPAQPAIVPPETIGGNE